MRQQTGRQHPVLRNILKLLQHLVLRNILKLLQPQSSAQKYSQTIATSSAQKYFQTIATSRNNLKLLQPQSRCWGVCQPLVPQLLSDGHHLSHIGSIEGERKGKSGTPQGGEPLVQVQLDLLCARQPSICSLACQRMLFEWQWTKVASPAGVEAAACCWSV